jgi:hypothetical protein
VLEPAERVGIRLVDTIPDFLERLHHWLEAATHHRLVPQLGQMLAVGQATVGAEEATLLEMQQGRQVELADGRAITSGQRAPKFRRASAALTGSSSPAASAAAPPLATTPASRPRQPVTSAIAAAGPPPAATPDPYTGQVDTPVALTGLAFGE